MSVQLLTQYTMPSLDYHPSVKSHVTLRGGKQTVACGVLMDTFVTKVGSWMAVFCWQRNEFYYFYRLDVSRQINTRKYLHSKCKYPTYLS